MFRPAASRPASPLLFVVAAFCGSQTCANEPPQRFSIAQRHMGTQFSLQLFARSEVAAQTAATRAFRRIAELDDTLSDYKPDSELSRLNRTAGTDTWVQVSDELWTLLKRSYEISNVSDGAFDITVGPYVRLWRRARRDGLMPTVRRLQQAKQAVGFEYVRFDDEHQRIQLTQDRMRLDLGGIAKGYAADEALRVLKKDGISIALIDAGGDIVAGESPPGKEGWKIEIAATKNVDSNSQTQFVTLANQAIATSGDAYQYVEIDGKRYSHIVDPRTGLGVTQSHTVTVIAKDGTTADALASAVSVLGPTEGIRMIDKHTKAAVLVVSSHSSGENRHLNARMSQFKVR